MHWNQIEYAKGEAVVACRDNTGYCGIIVGVHVQPGRPVRYYVQTSEGVREYAAAQIRRVKE